MTYRFSLEKFEATWPELEPLYARHYGEMQARLAGQGIMVPDFDIRLDEYFSACRGGYLLNFVVRTLEGEPVGYSNIYLTSDMHNRQFIAEEDTIYVLPDHRNGVGRRFAKFILDELRSRGVKKLNVVALTDLRVAKLWKRMGFREVGIAMTYDFEECADV